MWVASHSLVCPAFLVTTSAGHVLYTRLVMLSHPARGLQLTILVLVFAVVLLLCRANLCLLLLPCFVILIVMTLILLSCDPMPLQVLSVKQSAEVLVHCNALVEDLQTMLHSSTASQQSSRPLTMRPRA